MNVTLTINHLLNINQNVLNKLERMRDVRCACGLILIELESNFECPNDGMIYSPADKLTPKSY